MDAHKLWMLRDFIGTNKVLFRIPVHQRNYDWSESNCNRLLDDIYGIMQSGDKHFLGTIVLETQSQRCVSRLAAWPVLQNVNFLRSPSETRPLWVPAFFFTRWYPNCRGFV